MARTHKKELANISALANLVFGIMAGLCPITSTWYPSYSTLSSDTKSTIASSISHIQVPVWSNFKPGDRAEIVIRRRSIGATQQVISI
jgi:hypothetical protein